MSPFVFLLYQFCAFTETCHCFSFTRPVFSIVSCNIHFTLNIIYSEYFTWVAQTSAFVWFRFTVRTSVPSHLYEDFSGNISENFFLSIYFLVHNTFLAFLLFPAIINSDYIIILNQDWKIFWCVLYVSSKTIFLHHLSVLYPFIF